MVEFTNGVSVRAWLKTRSIQEIAVFSGLAAARVFLAIVHNRHWKTDTLVLTSARCILSAFVFGKYDSEVIKQAAAASTNAFTGTNVKQAINAAFAASCASGVVSSTPSTAYDAVEIILGSNREMIPELAYSSLYNAPPQSDDFLTAVSQQLFPAGLPPELEPYWNDLKDQRENYPETWGFWIDWYEGLLEGRAPDWELWHDVVLIPNEHWGDPKAVAREIERIKAALVARRFPLAEDLVANPETGVFHVEPWPIARPKLLAASLGQVSDAVEDVLADPSNGLNDQSSDIRKLRRCLERYGNDPQRVEMDMTSVHGSVSRLIAVGELPASDENLALVQAVQEAAQGVRATDAEVAANRLLLQERALAELTEAQIAVLEEAAPVMEALTEGDLQGQMAEDILYLTQEMRVGPPRLPGVTRDGVDEMTRVLSRAAKMELERRKDPDWVQKIDASSPYKGMRIVATLHSLINLGYTVGGFLFSFIR